MDNLIEELKEINLHGRNLTVSNYGRVFYNGSEIYPRVNRDGYYVVTTGTSKTTGVHRLVAIAFLERDDNNKNEVNHIDFNRKNNIVTNLEWTTHSENVQYSHSNGRHIPKFGEQNPNYGNRKLSEFYKKNPEISIEKQSRKGERNGKSVKIELYKNGNIIMTFNYIGECCEYLHKNYGFNSNAEIVRSGIRRSTANNVPYRGFTFKKMYD